MSFCGYSIPHPAEALVNIRVQTTGRCWLGVSQFAKVVHVLFAIHILSAGEVSATEALRGACQSLKGVCLHAKQTFRDANAQFDNQAEDMQT